MNDSVENLPLPPVIPQPLDVGDGTPQQIRPRSAQLEETDDEELLIQELVFSPPRSPTTVTIQEGRSVRGTMRRTSAWFLDAASVSSTDTRASDGSSFVRASDRERPDFTTKPGDPAFSRLPIEILRHICDSYISVKQHIGLRLVSRRFNSLVISNCVFWQRKIPDYRTIDDELNRNCLLKQQRRRMSSVADAELFPQSQANSIMNSPVEQHLSPIISRASSFTNASQRGNPISYCFNGCAFRLWRSIKIMENAKTFRKNQRHELRAIVADSFASILFPTNGSNGISCFFSLCLFGLAIAELTILHFRPFDTTLLVMLIPIWFVFGAALPVAAMYMAESTFQRRVAMIMIYVGAALSAVLCFLFRIPVVGLELPWFVCLLPSILAGLLVAITEVRATVLRFQHIAGKLVFPRAEFINIGKQHVPITPIRFLWVNSTVSVFIVILFLIGLFLFALENDGVISVTAVSYYNFTNTTGGINVTTRRARIGSAPPFASGIIWFLGWILCFIKFCFVILAYYSKHLRKYLDCTIIVVGHQLAFLVLSAIALLLALPGTYFNFNDADNAIPPGAQSLSMLQVILASPQRCTHLYNSSMTVLAIMFFVTMVNTLSGKEKYYKTSLKAKYLPYFDQPPTL
jgi:hypothetical protein